MAKVKIGDKVKALRSHNKAIELEGIVVQVDEDHNYVEIKLTAAAGAPVKHDAFESIHPDDMTILEKAKLQDKGKKDKDRV